MLFPAVCMVTYCVKNARVEGIKIDEITQNRLLGQISLTLQRQPINSNGQLTVFCEGIARMEMEPLSTHVRAVIV